MRIAVAALAVLLLAACGRATRTEAPAAPEVSARDVAVPGGTIHVEVAGAGPDVLLIHGGFGDRRMWDRQFMAFAAEHRVARLDLRGFGKSTFPEAAYSAADDVRAVLDALGMRQAHVVGNSMGGALAIDVALAYPDRVASIVVEASGPNGFPAAPEDRARFKGEIDAIVAVFRAAAAEGSQRGADLWKRNAMVVVAHADPAVAPLLHTMIDDNQRIFAMQFWPDDDKRAVDRLDELRVPTLLIVGDRDIALVRASAAYAAERIDGARLVTMPGADHLPHLEQPDAFNRLVLDFLAQH